MYDSWKTASPTDDLPSVESETCDVPKCGRPWVWETDEGERLCEHHAEGYLRAVPAECHPEAAE